jgi:transposase-like protein
VLQFAIFVVSQIVGDVAREDRGFEEFHPIPGTPVAYASKYTLLAYKVNWKTFAGKELNVERKWHERYPEKFRCRAVVRMNACDNIVRLARELGRNRSLLYKWRHRLDPVDGRAQSEIALHNSRESTLRREIDKLKRLLANKTVEVDFFRIALQKAEARRRNSGISGE